jgi:hypothetical protein
MGGGGRGPMNSLVILFWYDLTPITGSAVSHRGTLSYPHCLYVVKRTLSESNWDLSRDRQAC